MSIKIGKILAKLTNDKSKFKLKKNPTKIELKPEDDFYEYEEYKRK